MRVLVTGAGGQLGLDLLDAFDDHEVVGLTRAQLDITDEAAVAAAVAALRPQLVVNAAAATDVDGCETDPQAAHRGNALGPWWLARACEREGATLVTFSTDYVFDGVAPAGPAGAPRGFVEQDPVRPLSVYGRSKAAGEHFVRTMLRLAAAGGPIRVVDDQTGSPTTTRDLAAAVRDLAVSGRYGTVHLVNDGIATWFDVAAAVFAATGQDVDLGPQPSSAMQRPAARPAWSVLDTTHAATLGVGPLPHWLDGLGRLLDELGVRGSGAR
jgi:dTDP-4-dehydrorhamnose reductase